MSPFNYKLFPHSFSVSCIYSFIPTSTAHYLKYYSFIIVLDISQVKSLITGQLPREENSDLEISMQVY